MVSSKKYRLLKIILASLLVLGVIVVGVLLTAGHAIQEFVNREGSKQLGRDFVIEDPIKIDWNWQNPHVILGHIRIGNLPGAEKPNMVTIDNVDFHIKIWRLLEGQLNLPDVTIDKPSIMLEKIDAQKNNWTFPTLSTANAAMQTALPSKRSNFPIIGQLTIHQGALSYRDDPKNLTLDLHIDNANGNGAEQKFILGGQGKFQNKDFTIDAQAGSLDMLRNSHEPYPLNLHIKMGDTFADITGTLDDPIKMEGIDTKLSLRGNSLSDLFYLTLIPLPPTPAYALSGYLVKQGDVWQFENFQGKVGNSDLNGNLSYKTIKGQRGSVEAQLISKLLDFKDLAGFIGATPMPRANEKAPEVQTAKAEREKASPQLFPDVPLDLTRLRATDLDINFKADKIQAPGWPIDAMNTHFNLKDGILRIDPLEFGVADGKISGSLVLDGQKDIPHVVIDLSLSRLSLKQFFDDPHFSSLAEGRFGGAFKLDGNGKSLADVLGDSDGRITLVMSGGTISALIVNAAGLDLGHAAPALLGQDKATGIRCAVGQFDVKKGVLDSKIFVFDTTISNIAGKARIDLKNETIDAKITAEPKSPTITAHTPITIDGPLKHPAIGLDPTEAAPRAGVAAALSVFLTPIAAIIPFIELGVGEDSSCKDLIDQARQSAAVGPNGGAGK